MFRLGKSSIAPPVSSLYDFERGVHMTLDPETGLFNNVPQSLISNGALPVAAVGNVVKNADIGSDLVPSQQQHEGGDSISQPYEVEHIIHVDYNSETGFSGLPPEWERILKTSGLAKQQIVANPQAAIAAMNFMNGSQQPKPRAQQPSQLPDISSVIKNTDPHKFLSQIKKLDEGSTCTVYTAVYNGRQVAVKEMQLNQMNEKVLLDETRLMSSMKDKRIVEFISAHRVGNTLWIIMEYMDGGSLTKVATLCECQEPHIAYFAREILKALEYMHSHDKIHRDIKTDNVLLGSDGSVKLADFGYTAQLSSRTELRKSIVGTPYWMAPELIQGLPYSFGIDIWSLGILCRELADGEPPYVDDPPMKALYMIVSQGIPEIPNKEKWSPLFLDFLSLCLNVDPSGRPSASQLLRHPFLNNACPLSYVPPLLKLAHDLSQKDAFDGF